MKPLHLAAAALIGLGCSTFPLNAAADEYCVPLENGGSICGETQSEGGNNYSVFKGIQYATAERWSPSQLVSSYETNTPATEFGAICPQPDYPGPPPVGTTQDEDCLYLNIWTPKTSENSQENLPVMVFIHGGGFISGSSSAAYPPNFPDKSTQKVLYDGTTFASEQGVILVTINYRLGALGFLDLGPTGTSDAKVGGNYGLQDQVTALKWVQENIAALGGDKNNVTLFGESAGAMSTGLHLLSSDQAKSDFHAAIMESNPIGYNYRTAKQGDTQATKFIKCINAAIGGDAKCSDAQSDILPPQDKITTEDIITAQKMYARNTDKVIVGLPAALPFAPIVDGSFITAQPSEQIRHGSPKPLIFGFNKDEGVYFANWAGATLTASEYLALVGRLFKCSTFLCPNNLTKQDRYNPAYNFSPVQMGGLIDNVDTALSDLINDFAFSCSNMAANQTSSQKPIWAYYFTQTDAIQNLAPPNNKNRKVPLNNVCAPDNQWSNSCHAAELPFVFNSLPEKSNTSLKQLAKTMNTAWATFARNHNPAGPDIKWEKWEKVVSAKAHLHNFATQQNPSDDDIFNTQNCSSWLSTWQPRLVDYNATFEEIQESMK
ncbi:carboxylesterase family protein [Pseudovibrio brasiliensis]|uniref:Carboxylesterase family protein n=1 Tax=Pseudovibrio brasiliensis TaxID=1898042 RepID=A0ABX8APA0_9HYPH|nr:carboxylesterase family protein [Pseudovibrio brasiliensis]QUS55720.1 carboxylesterase family protein [Pseudovibrio brasiliensis]